MKVFLSYRRDDSQSTTDRIYDWLDRAIGQHDVFKDVDSIPYGADFHQTIRDAVGQCDVLLAVIGSGWLTAAKAPGMRRVDDPDDFVRMEIETAIERDIPIVPLLVNNATMPTAEDLPPSLRPLVRHNGMLVRPDPDFRRDMERLIAALSRMTAVNQAATKTTVASSANPSRFGQPVTFTATVKVVAPGGGVPTGTVTFYDSFNGSTITLGTAKLNDGSGQATISISTLSVGSHSITASYSGDVNFTTSTSAALTQTINPAAFSFQRWLLGGAVVAAPTLLYAILAITPGKGPAENAKPQPPTPPAIPKAPVETKPILTSTPGNGPAENAPPQPPPPPPGPAPPIRDPAVQALVEALNDKDGGTRRAAAESLGQLGDKSAAPALMKRVADDVWVAGHYEGSPKNDPNAGGKAAALEALKLLAPEKVTAALVTALKSTNERVRSWAATELQNQKGDETAVEGLVQTLNDNKEGSHRAAAVKSLAEIGGQAAVKPLIGALNDKDGGTRKAAAESLGKLGDKSAAPALMKRVADDVWVAGHYEGSPENDPNAGGKAAALEALKLLAPEKVTAALATALKSKNERVRSWAAIELRNQKVGSKEDAPE